MTNAISHYSLFFQNSRCFPHVINLAVKAVMKALIEPYQPSGNMGPAAQQYQLALGTDLFGRMQKCVNTVQSSGTRRSAFEKVIIDGNARGGFGTPCRLLRRVGLLKNMEVHWSAGFRMLDRFLELYLAIEEFLKSDWDLEAEHHFNDIELEVLHDFQDLLYIFHVVQELVSAEKTPTLSIVLPLYEQLTVMLADFKVVKPQLAHAIEPGIAKLKAYLAETQSTKAYAMAMGTSYHFFEMH
ncbi:hypothetical protein BJ165DRAFT_1348015 [Panaeolus papilionaceus]|nr:hypothetical protein BJ165DRAFT_1348015 [Panaeolus papilionaceus]